MRKALLLIVFALLFPAFVSGQATLRVAAAADLGPVLPPILRDFEKQSGVRVEATYQASAALTAQIQNGAPFDVFLSADLGYPERLIAAGVAEGSAPLAYARGTLVLWTRKDGAFPSPTLDALRSPSLKRLAIANPDRAPYGRAAVAALKKLGLYEQLQPRLATAENIAQAAQFVDSGNADAGLISMTSAMTPRLRANGNAFAIPRELYPPIEQGAVVLKRTQQREAGQKFMEFLVSPAVQVVFGRGGLTPVK
jgi:molybdate transport system substrate-binding protein